MLIFSSRLPNSYALPCAYIYSSRLAAIQKLRVTSNKIRKYIIEHIEKMLEVTAVRYNGGDVVVDLGFNGLLDYPECSLADLR